MKRGNMCSDNIRSVGQKKIRSLWKESNPLTFGLHFAETGLFFPHVRDGITEQGRTNKERIFITLLICCCFEPHNLCHFFVSEQCCGGKIGPNYGPRDSDCCGNQAFNSRISFCHGGTVYQRCNYKTYDPAAFLCCKGEVVLNDGGNNTKCCGKKSYNRYIKKYKASTRLLVLLS